MLIKRPIYNQKLHCVALEIMAHKKNIDPQQIDQLLTALLEGTEKHLPLFIPYALKDMMNSREIPIENPIILNLDANEIDTIYKQEELENTTHSIALIIHEPKQLAWLNFAEYVGFGEKLSNMAEAAKIVKISQAKQRKVIAHGIDQPKDFEHCKVLGMDYYCGDFLFQPVVDDATALSANKFNLLELIRFLQTEETDVGAITDLIQSDPLLSYQLLKIANSAAYAGLQPVESINQAISRLGLIQLKNWVMVFSMKNISNKPIEVIESGLIRAHMASKLARNNKPQAYTAGLLSILDSILNKPMTELLDKLYLSEEIENALIKNSGELGELLTIVKHYESGNFDAVPVLEYNGQDLSETYITALRLVSEGRVGMS